MLQKRGLGTVECDAYWTEVNGGGCSDSYGNLLTPEGAYALEVQHAADDPNYSVTVSANAAAVPKQAGLFGMDPKTLALIIGALLVFVLLKSSKR